MAYVSDSWRRPLPLADGDLDALFDVHDVNEAGREFVRAIRSRDPIRAVRPGHGHVCVRFPSHKMGRTIQCESRTCELPFAMEAEWDSKTHEYYDQPERLSIAYQNHGGRNVRVSHVPDFLVVSEAFVGFVECKPEDRLRHLAECEPRRWQSDDDGKWRSEPGERAAEAYGLGYRVWSSGGVNWTLTENGIFLEDYFDDRCRYPEKRKVEAILSTVGQCVGISTEELVHKTGDSDAIFSLIAHGKLHVDLTRHRLSEPESALVFLDASTARVWRTAKESPPDWRDPSEYEAKWSEFAQEALGRASERAREVALERYVILKPVIEGEIRIDDVEGAPTSTARRWLTRWRRAERDAHCGFLGLLPDIHARGNRVDRMNPEIRRCMHEASGKIYEDPKNVTALVAYGHLQSLCEENGQVTPSYQTFCTHLRKQDRFRSTAKRRGYRAAVANHPSLPSEEESLMKEGARPFDIVHIDHTKLDVFLRLGGAHPRNGAIERVWLTIAVCSWSRCILGYSLSFDPPSYVACMMVVRDMVRRHERLPRVIVVDNAKEFGCVAFEQLCAAYGIQKWSRPPGEPRYGSQCERLFGTTNTQFIHILSGNTQLLRDPRGMSAEVDPRKSVLWTFRSFDERLQRYLFDVYPSQPHSNIGEPPKERFAHGLREKGTRSHRKVPYDRSFVVMTLPPSKRGTAKVDRRTGIQVDNIRYHAKALQSLHGKTVRVRVDPENAGHVFAWVGAGTGWVECLSSHYAILRARSLREVWLASTIIRKSAGKGRKTPRVTAVAIAGLLADVTKHEALERQRLREEARRDAEPILVTGADNWVESTSCESCTDETGSRQLEPARSGSEGSAARTNLTPWSELGTPVELD